MTAKVSCASRIKEAMDRLDMKPTDLVRITGIPKGTMSQYLSGKYEPSQPRTELIAKALNVDEAWLMGYDVEKYPLKAENQPKELPLAADIKELIECYQLCNAEDKEELLMLARHKVKKNKPDAKEFVLQSTAVAFNTDDIRKQIEEMEANDEAISTLSSLAD